MQLKLKKPGTNYSMQGGIKERPATSVLALLKHLEAHK